MTGDAHTLIEELRASVRDERVLGAIGAVPRERFVLPADLDRAYENIALPIAGGQTISQPLVVGRMLELLTLRPGDVVLDVGTGSGYHAALLAQLVEHVATIERLPELSHLAELTLRELGIKNVSFHVGDGAHGLAQRAPFDAINVAAAYAELPTSLTRQLALGGRIVAPIGGSEQYLVRAIRTETGIVSERLEPVRFVPLISRDES